MIQITAGNEAFRVSPGELWQNLPAGSDTYRDTPADAHRAIINDVRAGTPWRDAVANAYRLTYPWLYKIVCDPSRMLFFVQNPPRKGSRILDIGAGWGQFTLPLAKTNEVVALEPTAERLEFIQASAEQEGVQGNITYVQADYLDVRFEPVFDLILCIGVLEWVPRFRDGVPWELQMQFLRTARSQLAPGGRIVVGIENRFGLKYLLGSSDDHIGSPNIAVLHAELANARFKARTGTDLRSFTYTSSEYARLFKEAGFLSVKAYAAFPDYKIASLILPLDEHFDRALLGVTFPPEHDGSCGEPHLPEFQEALNSHYRSLADLGIARFFVPSFYFELRA